MTDVSINTGVLCYAKFTFPRRWDRFGNPDHICRFCGEWATHGSLCNYRYDIMQGYWVEGYPDDDFTKPDDDGVSLVPCCDRCCKKIDFSVSDEIMVLGHKFHIDTFSRQND